MNIYLTLFIALIIGCKTAAPPQNLRDINFSKPEKAIKIYAKLGSFDHINIKSCNPKCKSFKLTSNILESEQVSGDLFVKACTDGNICSQWAQLSTKPSKKRYGLSLSQANFYLTDNGSDFDDQFIKPLTTFFTDEDNETEIIIGSSVAGTGLAGAAIVTIHGYKGQPFSDNITRIPSKEDLTRIFETQKVLPDFSSYTELQKMVVSNQGQVTKKSDGTLIIEMKGLKYTYFKAHAHASDEYYIARVENEERIVRYGQGKLAAGDIMEGTLHHEGRMPNIIIDEQSVAYFKKLGAAFAEEAEVRQIPEADRINFITDNIHETVHQTFKRWDYAGIKPTTNEFLEKGEIRMSEFIKAKWGDCRHHAIATQLMLDGAGVDARFQYLNTTRFRMSEDHAVVVYKDRLGVERISDSYSKVLDRLPVEDLKKGISSRAYEDLTKNLKLRNTYKPRGLVQRVLNSLPFQRFLPTRRKIDILTYPRIYSPVKTRIKL
ncbi:MAG: hypothetical protein H6618_06785 [Deltaproteobacteria bacterium]|nr:hypothetical protein [Deltaproteobacteria bacterium]